MRAGDVIVMLNDKDVKGESSREVLSLLRDVKPDSKVKLRVLRDGKPMDFEVVPRPVWRPVRERRASAGAGWDYGGSFGPFSFKFEPRSELNGLEVTTLTPQLGRYFGTEKGVLVVRAPKNDAFKLDLLLLFASNPRRVFSRFQLLDELWDVAFDGDPATVTVHIRRLREKIEAEPSQPRRLVTVWGVGYRFEP